MKPIVRDERPLGAWLIGTLAVAAGIYGIFWGWDWMFNHIPTPSEKQLHAYHFSGSNGPEGYSNDPDIIVTARQMPPLGCATSMSNDPRHMPVCDTSYKLALNPKVKLADDHRSRKGMEDPKFGTDIMEQRILIFSAKDMERFCCNAVMLSQNLSIS